VDALRLRTATPADAPALLRLYRPYVEAAGYCFELEAPTESEFAARIERALQHWDWRIAERAGRILGYAYAGQHRERAAYRYSCEVSAYVDAAACGQGIGHALYADLLPRLAARGFHTALAVIVHPNPTSEVFHTRHDFERIGIFREAGFKQGRWWDVVWMQRRLGGMGSSKPS
jgi:L-amino acid N-acyltransferase YncA